MCIAFITKQKKIVITGYAFRDDIISLRKIVEISAQFADSIN